MLQTSTDAYKSVFDIRAGQRPPSPYALLHLPEFEVNRERIGRAAERARQRLEVSRDSVDALLWSRLHDELEDAIDCLLSSHRKALLDASLKRKCGAVVEPPEAKGINYDCPQCSTTNSDGSQFCQNCGIPQWKRCVACNSTCHVSQAFCNDCGVNLAQADQKAIEELRDELERGVALAKEYEFEGASRLLHRVAIVEDARFDAVCGKAIKWINKVGRFRETAATTEQDLIRKAKVLIERRQYIHAVNLLQSHPEKLRGQDSTNLLSDATRRQEELQRIRDELATAVKEKKLQGLSSKIERLRDVSPNPDEVTQLEKQLASRFLKLANQSLESRQFENAIRLLGDVPKKYRNETVRALEEEAREFNYLTRELKHAAAITPTVQAIAKKLLAAAIPSESGARSAKDLATASTAPTELYDAFRLLEKKPPSENAFGKPVRWFGRCRRIRCNADAARAFEEHPGVWFPAVGLALQAIGAASVKLNLLPAKGFLSGLVGGGGKKPNEAWGVDFGNHAIKAVRLVRQADRSIVAEQAFHLEHGGALQRPHGETENKSFIQQAIERLSEHCGTDAAICLGLPPSHVLARFVPLPPSPSKKDADIVDYEARSQFPMGLEDLYWSAHVPHSESELASRNALLIAARRTAVAELLDPMSAKKLKVTSIQGSSLGLHNYLLYDYFDAGEPTAGAAPVVVLDVGASRSTLLVSSPAQFWQAGVQLGGAHFTNAMTAELKLTFSQAEQLKQQPWLAKRFHHLSEIWAPAFRQLDSEIHRALSAYTQQFPNSTPYSMFVGVGGGFAVHGLFDFLRRAR